MQWPDYETRMVRVGQKGLMVGTADDLVVPEACLVFRNLRSSQGGPATTRPGYVPIGGGSAGPIRSMTRLEDLARGTYARYTAAADGGIYAGQDSLGAIHTGNSQYPVAFVPYRTVLNGDPWVLWSDPDGGPYKARYNGSGFDVLPLGLPRPSVKPETEISDILTTRIAMFDDSDGTEASTWVPHGGQDTSDDPVDVGEDPDVDEIPDGSARSGPGVALTVKPGAAETGYYSWMAKPVDLDLTKLQGGLFDSSDQDYVHIWLRASDPSLVSEIRLYLICSASFDDSVIPGTDDTQNTDAFVKSIRPSDFQNYVEIIEDALTAAARARRRKDSQDYVGRGGDTGPAPRPTDPPDDRGRDGPGPILLSAGSRQARLRPTLAPRIMQEPGDSPTPTYPPPHQTADITNINTTQSPQLGLGKGVWSDFGAPGRPLRKVEFTRIGTDKDRGWATITGLLVLVVTTEAEEVTISLDDWYLTGGFGPDTGPAEASPYDYRYTYYDTRSGAESNPSAIQEDDERLQPFRSRCTLTGTPYGDAAIHQRFYRRGGTLVDHWYFVGESEEDGGEVVDKWADGEIQNAGTVELDNFECVEAVGLDGERYRANPSFLMGPLDGHIIAGGVDTAAGTIAWCKAENPDAWPVDNQWDVCAASDPLINGVIFGPGGLVFSARRMFAVQSDGEGHLQTTPTECTPGLAAKGALCVTPFGVAYVATDGIRVTSGSASEIISRQIDPIFYSQEAHDLQPIDWDDPWAITLASADTKLFFFYHDVTGVSKTLVYDFTDQVWAEDIYATPMTAAHKEDGLPGMVLGGTNGSLNQIGGVDDAGAAILCRLQTGHWDFGETRKDKKLGDVVLDCELPTGQTMDLTVGLNNQTIVNTTRTKEGTGVRSRYTYDLFGEDPQRARNITLHLQWVSTTPVKVWAMGVGVLAEPDVTYLRATTWEQMGPDGAMGYLTGCTMTIDTGLVDKTFLVEYAFDIGNQAGSTDPQVASTLVVNARHAVRRLHFSWPAVRANIVRLRPLDPCVPILLYKIEWHVEAEPPYISKWDSNHEDKGDQYYTGLDMVIDTYGHDKEIRVFVDQQPVINPVTGTYAFTVNAAGKQRRHISFGPGTGHIFRVISPDDVRGHWYSHEWRLDPEPHEEHNWNQNFTVAGSMSDKWMKGMVIECDTYGQDKTLAVEVDGVVKEYVTVNTDGRKVVEVAFADQYLGRVVRMLPVDHNPGKLYQPVQWIFDLEPLQLNRWNTQELDFGIRGWFMPLDAMITLRADADVTLRLIGYDQLGTVILAQDYVIPASPSQLKTKRYVSFKAMKCALLKFLAVSSQPFHLHREESFVTILPWGSGQAAQMHPLGNDDLDPTRGMGNASLAAATPGGMAG